MKKVLMLAVVAAIVAGNTAIQAASVNTYNDSVNATQGNGNLYFGTGNPNGLFAVTTDSALGIQLGLRADIRGGSLITATNGPTGVNNLYTVPLGFGGSPNGALWDFVYSIDVGTGSLSDYTANIEVTPTLGIPVAFDPFSPSDNEPSGSTHVAQNAENIIFGLPPALGDLIASTPNQYKFDLTLTNKSTGAVTEDIMFVNAVPLPSAAGMGLGMLGLIGAAGLLRKKFGTA